MGRGESVNYNLNELVCTGNTSLISSQPISSRNFVNDLVSDALSYDKHICSYPLWVGENRQSPYTASGDSEEERRGHIHLPESDGDVLDILHARMSLEPCPLPAKKFLFSIVALHYFVL